MLGAAKIVTSPKEAIQAGINAINAASAIPLRLMICTKCDKFVVQCSDCKNLQKGFPGAMSSFTLSCEKCKHTLTD